MLVRDMINAIANKQLKIKDLADQYGVTPRTIKAKIKNMGFEWNPKEARHMFTGDDESVYDLHVDDVLKSETTSKKASTSTAKKEVIQTSKEIAISIQDTIESKPKSHNKKTSEKESDIIDMLLAGKKAKKTYRGFYFDNDVLAVIDNVESGIKSELVNQALRKVFKDKGLL